MWCSGCLGWSWLVWTTPQRGSMLAGKDLFVCVYVYVCVCVCVCTHACVYEHTVESCRLITRPCRDCAYSFILPKACVEHRFYTITFAGLQTRMRDLHEWFCYFHAWSMHADMYKKEIVSVQIFHALDGGEDDTCSTERNWWCSTKSSASKLCVDMGR